MAVYQTHFAEDIVKDEILKKFKNKFNVWIPSKDTGIDILLTDKTNKKVVTLQVKWSKNYYEDYKDKESYGGWFQIKKNKLESSIADYWVLVIPSNSEKKFQFIIVKPSELIENYVKHGLYEDKINSYIDIRGGKVYEGRGICNSDRKSHCYEFPTERELLNCLNRWDKISDLL